MSRQPSARLDLVEQRLNECYRLSARSYNPYKLIFATSAI